VPMLRDGAKKRASSARTDRGKILNLIAVSSVRTNQVKNP
jgi:hypothetical protein